MGRKAKKASCEKCAKFFKGDRANQALGMHLFSAHGIRGKSPQSKKKRKVVKGEQSRGLVNPPDSPAYKKPEDIFMPRVCVHSSMPLEDYLNSVRAHRDLLGERYVVLSDIVEGIEYHLNGDAKINFEQTPTFRNINNLLTGKNTAEK